MRIIIFNESNNRVTSYIPSAHTPDYAGRSDVLFNPDLSGLEDVPIKYLMHDNGSVREMSVPEKNAIDSEEEASAVSSKRQAAKDFLDSNDPLAVAIRSIMIELYSSLSEARNKNGLSNRSMSQAINDAKTKIDNGLAEV